MYNYYRMYDVRLGVVCHSLVGRNMLSNSLNNSVLVQNVE